MVLVVRENHLLSAPYVGRSERVCFDVIANAVRMMVPQEHALVSRLFGLATPEEKDAFACSRGSTNAFTEGPVDIIVSLGNRPLSGWDINWARR
jgi:hypothetical protein